MPPFIDDSPDDTTSRGGKVRIVVVALCGPECVGCLLDGVRAAAMGPRMRGILKAAAADGLAV